MTIREYLKRLEQKASDAGDMDAEIISIGTGRERAKDKPDRHFYVMLVMSERGPDHIEVNEE